MDSSEFIACIGKAEDAPEVQKMLAAVGVTNKLKMPKDDIDARAQLPKLGLSLIFKPEGPKSSRLILNAVQFYSDSEQGYTSFPGTLPSRLLFSDSRPQAHAKLGEPFKPKPQLRRDIWKLQDLQLAINYTKDEPQRISVITVEIPLNR